MGCAVACSTGTTKLIRFFVCLGSPPHSNTHAFTLATFATLPILPSHYPQPLFPSESMSTTLSTSYLQDPAVKDLFCCLLAEHCKVNFMGIVRWFLGVHFSWRITPSLVAVHLNQSGFAMNLVESFSRQDCDITPTVIPYRSGIPINSIAPLVDADNSPSQLWRKEVYQSLIGSISWLSCSTRPDLTAVHSFLSSYTNKPATGHIKAALYALHYIPRLRHRVLLRQCCPNAFLHSLSTVH
jgi:hypothetical protein